MEITGCKVTKKITKTYHFSKKITKKTKIFLFCNRVTLTNR